MATTKKTTKKAPAKKPATKSQAVKKTSTKKVQMRSFHLSPEEQPFTDFRITRQTVYWVILIAFILFAQLWILKLQIEVAAIIDEQQVQAQQF
ncbi:MAG: hypothetical protein ACOH18_02215 [Candidatus Saccharimonadaceae bacterium]